MKIYLNGEQRELQDGMTVQSLLDDLALADKRLAVELNEEILPRGRHAEEILNANDRVEIIQAIGGG